jgi:hypothetical protein
MGRVTTVLLQGVGYHWDGRDILVDDGINAPWPMSGQALEQVELFDGEGEAVGAFSIDFEHQQWFLAGSSTRGDIVLLDETGTPLAMFGEADLLDQEAFWLAELPPPAEEEVDELVLPGIDEILDETVLAGEVLPEAPVDTSLPTNELLDDVVNWLTVYSHHD